MLENGVNNTLYYPPISGKTGVSAAIFASGALDISGGGTLTIRMKETEPYGADTLAGIMATGDLTIDGVGIDAVVTVAGKLGAGLYAKGDLSILNSEIYSEGGVTGNIGDGVLGSFGLYSEAGAIKLDGCTISAQGNTAAMNLIPSLLNMKNGLSGASYNGSDAREYASGDPIEGKRFFSMEAGSPDPKPQPQLRPDTEKEPTTTAPEIYPVRYQFIEGGNQIWASGDLVAKANGDVSKATAVYVDGLPISAKHYTLEHGSTIVTLKASYLATLDAGVHSLRVKYTDGYADTTFTIGAAQVVTDMMPPQTGDGGRGTPIGLAMLAVMAMAGVCAGVRRKRA